MYVCKNEIKNNVLIIFSTTSFLSDSCIHYGHTPFPFLSTNLSSIYHTFISTVKRTYCIMSNRTKYIATAIHNHIFHRSRITWTSSQSVQLCRSMTIYIYNNSYPVCLRLNSVDRLQIIMAHELSPQKMMMVVVLPAMICVKGFLVFGKHILRSTWPRCQSVLVHNL